jgi:hypothetical protein
MNRAPALSNRLSKKVTACLLLMVFAVSPRITLGASQTNKKEIIGQARLASYNLKRLGLLGFSANIKPNWEVVLKDQLKADPNSAQNALKLLAGLHFAMTFDSDGKVKVTHQADAAAPNEAAAAGFRQIFDGMDLMVSGFFDTWSLFMLTSAFPEVEADYQVEDLVDRYRLSYKERDASVVASMTRDFAITELLISATTFRSSIKPQFAKAEQGLMLTGYEASYTPTSGPGATNLRVQVGYQDVSGLQLPLVLSLDGTQDGSPFAVELHFTDHKVTRR